MTKEKLRIMTKIFPGTKNQQDVGILAHATVRLYVGESDTCLIELNKLTIRKRRDGSGMFVSFPAEAYTDANGDKKYANYFRIVPDEPKGQDDSIYSDFQNTVINAYKRRITAMNSSGERDVPPPPPPQPQREYRAPVPEIPSGYTSGDWDEGPRNPAPRQQPRNDDFQPPKDDDGWL